MNRIKNNRGMTLVELMVVIIIIIVGLAIAFFGFQSRLSHFRLRASTREMLEMMKLAQASAIRANEQYRIQILDNTNYQFQQWSPTLGGFAGISGRIGQQVTLPDGIVLSGNVCGGTFPCGSPVFNSDGTINPGPGGNPVSVQDSKTSETFSIQWSIGGSIRVQ